MFRSSCFTPSRTPRERKTGSFRRRLSVSRSSVSALGLSVSRPSVSALELSVARSSVPSIGRLLSRCSVAVIGLLLSRGSVPVIGRSLSRGSVAVIGRLLSRGSVAVIGLLFSAGLVGPAMGYTTNEELPGILRDLASRSGGILEVESLGEDAQGRSIPLVRAGSGRPEDPAVLVVAGLDGRHLIGTELALATLRDLTAAPDSARILLENRTLYVVPRASFDGAEAYFGRPSRAQAGIDGVADVDRDGMTGEDPAEDLDGDGAITWMRVRDPKGEWIERPDHPGLLRRADRTKGEIGEWRILVEGRDDDEDLHWNEEEDAGARLARNFPIRYPWFERGSARHQVSEPVTRALADFLVAHRNIAIVLVYGFEDNLLTLPPDRTSDPDPKSDRWNRQPIEQLHKSDRPLIVEIAKKYRRALGLSESSKRLGFGDFGVEMVPEELGGVPSPSDAARGGFAEFVYFARGRLALATPGWSPALQVARNDAAKKRNSEGGESRDKGGDDDGDRPERGSTESGMSDPDNADSNEAGPDATGSGAPDPGSGPDTAGPSANPNTADPNVADPNVADPDTAAAVLDPEAMDADSSEARSPRGKESEEDSALSDEENFRDWLVARDPAGWLGWHEFSHPDFPDFETYIGGYAPLARINPPPAIVDSIAPAHVALVEQLLSMLPRVRIREARLEPLGNGVHELRFTIDNPGYLPDRLATGVYSAEVRPTRYELRLPEGAAVLGAAPRGPIEGLEGSGGSQELRFLIRMPSGGSVTIDAISELGGRDTRTLRSGEHWRASEGRAAR